jgi:hypothetical protein
MAKLLGGGIAFLIPLLTLVFGAEFHCPNGGTITVMVKKETPSGEVLCVKERINFTGYVALPLKPNEVIFAQCNKTKEVK